MTFFSKPFGSKPKEQLDSEIRQGWFLSDDKIEKASAYLHSHDLIHLERASDPMDGYDILTLLITATSCEGIDLLPRLAIRAKKKGTSVIVEPFLVFKEKFLSGRGKLLGVRLKFGDGEPFTCGEDDTSPSTNGASVFFQSLSIMQAARTTDRILVQLHFQRSGSVLATFELGRIQPVTEFFFVAISGLAADSIATMNPDILNTVLRMGPQFTLKYKEGLAALGFHPGPLDYTKGFEFYEAIHKYAISRHTSEFFGVFDKPGVAGSKINDSWNMALYREMPSKIRKELGPLKIFD